MSEKEKTNEIIKNTLIEKGADFVALFGSYARGDEKITSDVDILVNFKEPISLFEHAGITMELENKIGRKVDLVTQKGMSRFIRPFITKDLVTLYEG